MHGTGVMKWDDGRRYIGQYKNGRRHGYGEYFWPGGKTYKGEWNDGRWSKGVLIGADGTYREISYPKD